MFVKFAALDREISSMKYLIKCLKCSIIFCIIISTVLSFFQIFIVNNNISKHFANFKNVVQNVSSEIVEYLTKYVNLESTTPLYFPSNINNMKDREEIACFVMSAPKKFEVRNAIRKTWVLVCKVAITSKK